MREDKGTKNAVTHHQSRQSHMWEEVGTEDFDTVLDLHTVLIVETDIFDIFLFWLYLGKSATFILLLVFHGDAFPEKVSRLMLLIIMAELLLMKRVMKLIKIWHTAH